MELFKNILATVLENEEIHVIFPNLKFSATEIVDMEAYKALHRIKTIIDNDSLSDFDCIEEIICILEEFGSDGGNRHDF